MNRLVNNNFYPQYIPTEELETYKIFFNNSAKGKEAQYVKLEILDCFPQDHQMLFTDSSTDPQAKEAQDTLQAIIKNEESSNPDKNGKWINAFIFVYNASDRASFKKLLKMIETVTEFEKSIGQGAKQDEGSTGVLKFVLGNKKDLKPHKKVLEEEDLRLLSDQDINSCIRLQEVSALTNYGVREVFQSIISEVVKIPVES